MAPTKQVTIASILQARDEARHEIYDKAQQLEVRAEAIKDIGYDRPLNAQELADLKAINAAKGSLYAAENELVLMTVSALDKTDETKRFLNVANATNADLKSKLQDVADIAANIKKSGDLFQKFTAVIQGLTTLLPLL
jgi:hypothetical protein